MREICMSGSTRERAVSGQWLYASHPVAPSLLYLPSVQFLWVAGEARLKAFTRMRYYP